MAKFKIRSTPPLPLAEALTQGVAAHSISLKAWEIPLIQTQKFDLQTEMLKRCAADFGKLVVQKRVPDIIRKQPEVVPRLVTAGLVVNVRACFSHRTWTRPARPLRCVALALLTQVSTSISIYSQLPQTRTRRSRRRITLRSESYWVSFILPLSITYTT